MKTTLLVLSVLILSCPLLPGQAQPSTPKPNSPWRPHLVSAEWVKAIIREEVPGLSTLTYDDAGELFLKVSVRFEYKGPEGEKPPLPPYVYVIDGTVEIPYACCPPTGSTLARWQYIVPDTLSQSSANCMQLLKLQQQAELCTLACSDINMRLREVLQVYSPASCAGEGFAFYFSLPAEPKTLGLVFRDDDTRLKHPPIPLNPKPLNPKPSNQKPLSPKPLNPK